MKTVKLGASSVGVATGVVGAARKEKNAQKMLERMQSALTSDDQTVTDKALKAALTEIATIEKYRALIIKRGERPVSSYVKLAELAEKEFSKVTKESLALEAQEKANKDKAKILGGANKDQATVIDRYHGRKAVANWRVIEHTRNLVAKFHKVETTPVVAETVNVEALQG